MCVPSLAPKTKKPPIPRMLCQVIEARSAMVVGVYLFRHHETNTPVLQADGSKVTYAWLVQNSTIRAAELPEPRYNL